MEIHDGFIEATKMNCKYTQTQTRINILFTQPTKQESYIEQVESGGKGKWRGKQRWKLSKFVHKFN